MQSVRSLCWSFYMFFTCPFHISTITARKSLSLRSACWVESILLGGGDSEWWKTIILFIRMAIFLLNSSISIGRPNDGRQTTVDSGCFCLYSLCCLLLQKHFSLLSHLTILLHLIYDHTTNNSYRYWQLNVEQREVLKHVLYSKKMLQGCIFLRKLNVGLIWRVRLFQSGCCVSRYRSTDANQFLASRFSDTAGYPKLKLMWEISRWNMKISHKNTSSFWSIFYSLPT